MSTKNFAAWDVSESDYPRKGATEEKLEFLLRYAILAPSGSNSQPWKFAISNSTISAFADLERSVPLVDPDNRILYMSVGCALANLLVAGEHFGFRPTINYFPSGQKSDQVAEVKFEWDSRSKGDLFPQITRRCTIKDKYQDRGIDAMILEEIKRYIELPGIHLHYLTDKASKSEIADLAARANHNQLADKEFRRHLGGWLRDNRTAEPDGMPLYTFGLPDAVSSGFLSAFKEFDLSDAFIYRESGLINGCAALGILSSDGDDLQTWSRLGAGLERYLLRATRFEIRASFFSQPIGSPGLRKELATMVNQRHPQLIFGLGYATPIKHTPRRPLQEVIIKR